MGKKANLCEDMLDTYLNNHILGGGECSCEANLSLCPTLTMFKHSEGDSDEPDFTPAPSYPQTSMPHILSAHN